MPSPSEQKDTARRRAQNHFAASEQRDNSVKQEIARARAATDAKTAKLRALRLAREAVEKEESDKLAAEKAAAKSARKAKVPRRKAASPASP